MSDDIFTKRGITDEIRYARPYTEWKTDDPRPIDQAYGGLGKAGLDFALQIAKQSPGYLINRFPPDDLGLEPIYPEFRPKNAVKTKRPIWHVHVHIVPPSTTPGEADFAEAARLLGIPLEAVKAEHQRHLSDRAGGQRSDRRPPWWVRTLSGQALEDHLRRGYNVVEQEDGSYEIERTPMNQKDPMAHLYPQDYARTDFHWHQAYAKYVFPTSPKIDESWSHDHRAIWHDHKGWSDKRIASHVAAEHGGSEVAWYGQRHAHPHTYDVVLSRAAEADWHKKAMHIAKRPRE